MPTYGTFGISPNEIFQSNYHAKAECSKKLAGPGHSYPQNIYRNSLKLYSFHRGRSAGVLVVPGSSGLLNDSNDAATAASAIGYPVMLKATVGGGGMSLLIFRDENEVRKNFETMQSSGSSLFKNASVFIERFYPESHHIDVQVFGNGKGKVISVGECECSIQRRHQKVIEECPSPFLEQKHPDLRQKLTAAAIRLGESIKYGPAGTVEFFVDDHTGDFFFLEMNARLQVDLVELMYRRGGIDASELEALQSRCIKPSRQPIETRKPARNYAPIPGLLQQVTWHEPPGTRIDTWVYDVSADYDPLLAKVMFYGATRDEARDGIQTILAKSSLCGPLINLDFLANIVRDPRFRSGNTTTKLLKTFSYTTKAIDVISGGLYTLIQDYPGRPRVGRGFGHAGPMDEIAFRAAKILVDNHPGNETLEITLIGPDIRFLCDASVALCEPPVTSLLDGKPMAQWSRFHVPTGKRVTIGKLTGNCRVYLAVSGGFPHIVEWSGSKATCPMVNIGGYQGRPLRAGDLFSIIEATAEFIAEDVCCARMSQTYILYLRLDCPGNIRLIGPRPKYARTSGCEGGSHPSHVTVIGIDLWKIGQLRPGDEFRFRKVNLSDALEGRRRKEKFLAGLTSAVASRSWQSTPKFESFLGEPYVGTGDDVALSIEPQGNIPRITHRVGADNYVLLDYGEGDFDLNLKVRTLALQRFLEDATGRIFLNESAGGAIVQTVSCGNSLTLFHDGLRLSQAELVKGLVSIERTFGNMRLMSVLNRHFILPATFTHRKLEDAMDRYMTNQRPTATYIPDSFKYLAEINGMSPDKLKRAVLLAADPRQRLRCPKMNPSGTYIPQGCLAWGGSVISTYPVDAPGDYMPIGTTMPGPWIFQDMGTVGFYEVTEEEYDAEMMRFKSGSYKYKMEESTFDLSTAEEVTSLLEVCGKFQGEMAIKEKKIPQEWLESKAATNVSQDGINTDGKLFSRSLWISPTSVESHVNANVWKVLVKDGDVIRARQKLAILEAMKMEIDICLDAHIEKATVKKVLTQPSDTVAGGRPLFAVSKF
ncbi:LOW QUALITY PROTEIN: putative urea amidolyase [Bipolaris maydis]|nr:LOW QUALITY PROTEIN: putative urea amidolyase [Bipolaris maydis]